LLPASGSAAVGLGHLTTVAIGLLFFLHGAKLSREAVVAGITHWRLHLLVLASTFVMFPLMGIALKPLALTLLTPELYLGILFLCVLPSTVQSSIAFTAMARGNVAAAVCSASASTRICICPSRRPVGPRCAGAAGGAGVGAEGRRAGGRQRLLRVVAGELRRPWIGAGLARPTPLLRRVVRGSFLLVVYTAF